ncbi:MAG TPA: tetratricopeptide repeat protein [Aromatoleum sp.]|uniref:tetratricopeptide repeat protein n=1 Tax=Aromatoleum sp. TaxID=2307007 RepID=UPI002B484F42|nr:tetratricopeptide repeat protein [Aromatoleum sp.]HJV25446.1 tetratricopeptide repeat protein [Aromatoleum sp.]
MITRHSYIDTRLTRILVGAVLAALVLLAYRGIESNGFHYDDWPNILNHAPVQMEHFSLEGLLHAAGNANLARRPVASLTFAIDWWRGEGSPAAFLVTNLALHILMAWATMALLLAVFRATAKQPASHAAIVAAGIAALWWASQPIHVQAVSYAVQRMTELAALFSVLCVWAYLKARQDGPHSAAWMLASALSFALGALSKENAWVTPALVLMAEFLIVRNDRPLTRSPFERLLLATPLLAIAAAVLDFVVDGPLSHWALRGYVDRDFTLTERLLTQPKVLLFHASQILWPLPDRFSLEHDVALVQSPASQEFWLPMSLILAWCAVGTRFAWRSGSRAVGFFMLWVPVTLFMESSFVPLQLIFEHRMYLPTVGVAGLVGFGLARTRALPRPIADMLWIAVGAATLFSGWSTSQRLPQWRNDISLYEQAVRSAPKSVGAWNQLALSYLEDRQPEQALRAINRAIEIEPRWGDGYPFVNRAVILEAMGQPDRAREIYDQVIELFPRQVLGYNNRGLLDLRANNPEHALRDFDRAIAVDPTYAAAWTNRGTAHLFLGNRPQAQSDFERATSLSPHEPLALHYLGQLYAAQRRLQDAAHARSQACRLGVEADCRANNQPSSSPR